MTPGNPRYSVLNLESVNSSSAKANQSPVFFWVILQAEIIVELTAASLINLDCRNQIIFSKSGLATSRVNVQNHTEQKCRRVSC
jgi:hypothetical protein